MGSKFLGLILLALLPAWASALCSSPIAGAGARKYFSGDNQMKICDGTNWISVFQNGTLGACSGPGKMEWDSGQLAYKFCDGTSNYQKIASPVCSITSVSEASAWR